MGGGGGGGGGGGRVLVSLLIMLLCRFEVGRNNSAAHFHNVARAFASLDALTNAVAQSFLAPLQVPQHSLIDVALDFERPTDLLLRSWDKEDTDAIVFYEAICQQYISEQARIVSGDVRLDE